MISIRHAAAVVVVRDVVVVGRVVVVVVDVAVAVAVNRIKIKMLLLLIICLSIVCDWHFSRA